VAAHIRKRRAARGRQIPPGEWVIKDFKGIWPFLWLSWEAPGWNPSFEPACNLDRSEEAIKISFEVMKLEKMWLTEIWAPYIKGLKEVFGCPDCFDKPINC
jgi:hypothetical protein